MAEKKLPLSAKSPIFIGTLALVLLIGGFGAWATLTTLSGAIIAPGAVEVDQNRQVIQHPTGGIVEAIHVDEGQQVEAGEVLLVLDGKEIETELAIVESQLFEIVARRSRLEAERDGAAEITFDPLLDEDPEQTAPLVEGQQRLYEARATSLAGEIEQLGKRREQIANQVTGIDAQRDALARQIELIGDELEDQQALLDRGLAQASRVLALEREMASLTGRDGELLALRAQAEGRITELDIQILQLASRQREDAIGQLRDLRVTEDELRERRTALVRQLDRREIVSPVAGRIYGLTVFTERAVLQAAEPLMYIVPQDRPLVIAVQVETVNIDEIHVGQRVNLRLSAFDQRRAPELVGEVVLISADAFQDERTLASYYRAEIVLAEGELERLPEDMVLVPGMPVESFIRTADRSPLSYLIKPLSDYFVRAFRES